MTKMDEYQTYTIGVLGLQGAFYEHIILLERLKFEQRKIEVVTVRTKDDLDKCKALVIPGGKSNLLEPLVAFCQHPEKPVLGTCAGMIMLSSKAEGAKKGGQNLFGGMSTTVLRNGFGNQLESFESNLVLASKSLKNPEIPFCGVFIRAPMVLSTQTSPATPSTPPASTSIPIPTSQASSFSPFDQPLTTTTSAPVEILATLPFIPSSAYPESNVVALRQGQKMACSFHPELSMNQDVTSGGTIDGVGLFEEGKGDERLHEYFVRVICLGLE
ncbi:Imidazoleglycerol-phosphate synthase subunit H-like [Phaffia rhodozyma]|uniref:Imidazoleglycerol-phosphate synthase subunit H-like n=1 Tax=Phaffia rhodozyma TaxID=264483 RepID=A0A0F7SPV1_PHARH|nr:Imidazoleglycerol-phosphate synthase subunit H-like [Phaffia rhodozyma]